MFEFALRVISLSLVASANTGEYGSGIDWLVSWLIRKTSIRNVPQSCWLDGMANLVG